MDFDAQSSSSSSSLSNVETPEKIESSDKTLAVSEVNLQEPSTLSPKQEEMDKEGVSQPKSENQDEKEVENRSLVDELPPEILMKILKCLRVKSLTVSRLVSRKWNEMAREILQSRNDVETRFICRKTEDESFEIVQSSQGGSLCNFINCFEDSKESPLYTCFRFDGINAFVFECEDWIKFISDFGPSIKSLRIGINRDIDDDDELVELANNLRSLLLNQLENIHEFGLRLPYWFLDPETPAFPSLQLVKMTTASNEEKTIQLANLKVLCLDEYRFVHYTDLLLAAVNLQKIEPFGRNDSYRKIETLQFLQSLGKLGCVQNASIDLDAQIRLDADFMSEIQGQRSMPFKLKKLVLRVVLTEEETDIWRQASIFISNLLESSKDTLRELEMDPLGFLPNLQLPKFSKLTKLTISPGVARKIQVFPSELNLNEFFPLLQKLYFLCWTDFFPHDESQNGSYFPSLKTLVISGRGMTKEDVTRISQVCPNLNELHLCRDFYREAIRNFPQVGEAIWTHLTKLASLDLAINLDEPANAFPAVDSTFTGFSGEDCSRLHTLIQNQKAAKRQRLKIKSESKIQLDAESPSILDLKDLRKLAVYYFCKGVKVDTRVRTTMPVSEECAFKLMKNLSYTLY